MCVFMIVHGPIRMGVLVSVLMLGIRPVRVLMRMLVGVRVLVLMILKGVIVVVLVNFVDDDVDLGAAQSSAHYLAALETRTDVQGCCGVLQQGKGNARIDQGAKEHVTGDAGEAFEIRNSHQ
jgi:hypothetical protein